MPPDWLIYTIGGITFAAWCLWAFQPWLWFRKKPPPGTPSRDLEKISTSERRANWWRDHPGEPFEMETPKPWTPETKDSFDDDSIQ